VKQFEDMFRRLAAHYRAVLAVHLNQQFSGTYSNGVKAAERVSRETGKAIAVVDSKQLSGSLGLLVLRAAQAIESGVSDPERLLSALNGWIGRTRIFVGVQTLKYMVRSGRVSPMKGRIARILHLKPIVSIRDGRSVLLDKSFTQIGSLKKIVKRLPGTGVWGYCILHAHNPEMARIYTARFREAVGKDPVAVMDISPAIGLHAGIGTVAAAWMTD
jgi:hypothetical protein